jgi:hypothetical protein
MWLRLNTRSSDARVDRRANSNESHVMTSNGESLKWRKATKAEKP